jgi:AcrR family transcriptional regulator
VATTEVPAASRSTRARSTRARPTDEQLLDAARTVFAARGFRSTTMAAVAEQADSTKPTLYSHFGDKNSLYARVLEREADICRSWLFAAYERNADRGLAEQVSADITAFFDYASEHQQGFRLLFGLDPTSDAVLVRDRLIADIDARVRRRLHDYLARRGGTARYDEAQLAAMLVGVAVSATRHAITVGQELAAASELASRFCIAGLAHLGG